MPAAETPAEPGEGAASAGLHKGDHVWYERDGVQTPAVVSAVDALSDSYTVLLSGGAERNTVLAHLRPRDDGAPARPALPRSWANSQVSVPYSNDIFCVFKPPA